jgi:hypothetical protein
VVADAPIQILSAAFLVPADAGISGAHPEGTSVAAQGGDRHAIRLCQVFDALADHLAEAQAVVLPDKVNRNKKNY